MTDEPPPRHGYFDKPLGGKKAADASPVTGEIDIAPIREAFERSGLTLTEVARRLGWTRPDQPRIGRALGYHRDHGRLRQQVTYETAVQLCRAIGIDPVDVGC